MIEAADQAGLSRDIVIEAIRMETENLDARFQTIREAGELLRAIGSPTSLDMAMVVSDPIGKPKDRAALEMDQGQYARFINQLRRDNPYSRGSHSHANWDAGWIEADKAEKEQS